MAFIEASIPASGLTLRDYIGIVDHRRGKMLLAFAAGLAITILLDVFLPARYQSTGTILIEQQEMPTDFVRSAVTSYADQRVQVISQRVMTTQTLMEIIKRYDLYPKERERESREAVIKKMKNDVAVRMISADVIDPRSGRPTSATIAFSVSYSNRSAEQASRVANELTTLYLNENLTRRTQLATDEASFLESEAERVSKHIAELEAQLAEFKAKHLESLPELVQLNMTLLDRTQQALETSETRKASLEQQLVYLQAQLVQLKPNSQMFSDSGERIMTPADRLKAARSELASARAVYAPDHPDIARLQREITGLEADPAAAAAKSEVNDLRRSLEEARGVAAADSERYAADHPDRQRAERQVAMLEKDLAAASAAAEAQPAVAAAGAPNLAADNPAYVQIQASVAATRADIEAIDAEQNRLRAQMAGYQHDITVSPQIEKDYRELSRDYENSKLKYQELRSKAGEATVTRNLETDRKGERFTLIEPPLVPEDPVSPNRVLVTILGVFLSAALALGTAALLESLDGSVRGRRDLTALLGGSPPLAIIPPIELESAAPQRLLRVMVRVSVVVLVIVAGLAAVHFFYRPLDVLWYIVLRKTGIS